MRDRTRRRLERLIVSHPGVDPVEWYWRRYTEGPEGFLEQAERRQREVACELDHQRHTHLGLFPQYYADKIVVEIGCGVLPTLERFDQARMRIGIDKHAVRYVRRFAGTRVAGPIPAYPMLAAEAERLPLPTRAIDMVLCVNSLRFMNPTAALADMRRVVKPRGHLVLSVSFSHRLIGLTTTRFLRWLTGMGFDVIDHRQLLDADRDQGCKVILRKAE